MSVSSVNDNEDKPRIRPSFGRAQDHTFADAGIREMHPPISQQDYDAYMIAHRKLLADRAGLQAQ